jgi:hypothetical protein
VLSRAPRLRALPPYSGGLRCCHVPRDFRPCILAQKGSDAAMYPVALNRPRALGIKNGLAGLDMQLGSRVSKALSRAIEAPVRRAGRRRHHDL